MNLLKNHRHALAIAIFILLLHFINNAFTTFGYFRDELYYIACSNHLAAGYVDQPPGAVWFLRLNSMLFGDSVFSLRLFPSIAHAFTVFIGAIFAKEFGGKTFAQVLTALCVGFSPGLLGMFGIFTVNAFDIALWQIVFFLFIRLIRTHEQNYWMMIGFTVGIGLMCKISMAWIAVGLTAGILLTPLRSWLLKPVPWVAAFLALTMFFPFVLWNINHDFAHFEFARNAAGIKYSSQNPMTFIAGMIPNYNPAAFPIWFFGMILFLKSKIMEQRVIGYSIIVVLLILIVNGHSKTEYFNPAIIVLFASGSVGIEQWMITSRRKVIGVAYSVVILFMGFVTTPMAIDILPVDSTIAYFRMLRITPSSTEGKTMGDLPQHFADRFGWKELADDVAACYATMSIEEKKQSVIYANNYGEAGAIDFFGKNMGLPQVVSGHNSYWFWGNGGQNVAVVIVIGGKKEDHLKIFDNVRLVNHHIVKHAMLYESNLPIYICTMPKIPMQTIWERVRHYD